MITPEPSKPKSFSSKTYTITSEGYIPSFKFIDIECPVKVAIASRDKFPDPVRSESGRLIFMLPGGMEIAPEHTQAKTLKFASSEFGGAHRRSIR